MQASQSHQAEEHKEPPDSGWEGPIPSHDGGDAEEDYYHKPPYEWRSDKFKTDYTMSCWCGRVAFEVMGEPVTAKCCHCKDCQRLHGAPFQHAVLFFKTGVRLTKNEDRSLTFFSTEKKADTHYVPCKVSCGHCHAPLFDEGRTMMLSYPSAFGFKTVTDVPDSFRPKGHIFYGARSMDVIDGVPKWSGHMGHSKLLPERTGDGKPSD